MGNKKSYSNAPIWIHLNNNVPIENIIKLGYPKSTVYRYAMNLEDFKKKIKSDKKKLKL